MRKAISVCFVICFLAVGVFGQIQPFAALDKAVEAQRFGFSENQEELSKIFNRERIRLGADFETELWKYLGEDVEKYYWLSAYLDFEGYLNGNKPLPKLAFKIRERAVEIIGDTENEENLGRKITFLRDLAIASYLSGKRDSALEYKKRAEVIYQKYEDIGAYVGATSAFDYCIYDNLEKDPTVCQKDEPQSEENISNGKPAKLKADAKLKLVRRKHTKKKKH